MIFLNGVQCRHLIALMTTWGVEMRVVNVTFGLTPFRKILILLVGLAPLYGCGGGGGYTSSPPSASPPRNSVIQNSGLTRIFPTNFDDVDKLQRDSSGVVSLLQGTNLSRTIESDPHYQRLFESRSYGAMAVDFVHFFKIPFQLEDPKNELNVTRVHKDDLGYHQVRLAQNYRSVPVLNSELIVHFDRGDHVYLVQGQYIRTPAMMDLEPKMTLNAVINAIKDHGNLAPASTNSGPVILPLDDAPPKLVYRLRSQVSLTDQSILLVDADSGVVLRKLPTIYDTR